MLPTPGRPEVGEINLKSCLLPEKGLRWVPLCTLTPRWHGRARQPSEQPGEGGRLSTSKSFVQFETSLKKYCSGGRSQWSFEYETERPPSPFPIT